MTKATPMEDGGMEFGQQLTETMEDRDLSMRDVALETGLSAATIHRACHGKEIMASHYRTLLRWIGQ